MAYISVNLGPTDPQPGNYSLYIQSCNGGAQQLIATGLTNPDSFPYYFETTDFSGTSGSTCITYELIDTITSCSCTGNVSLVTPTPTISLTPKPTPSLTPLGNNSSDYITIGGYLFDNGSGTSFDLNAFSKYSVNSEVEINLDITLKDSLGSPYTESAVLTLSRNSKSGSVRVNFTSLRYDDLDFSYIQITNERTNRVGDIINIHGNYIYGPSSGGPQGPQYVTHKFRSCCTNDTIFANVPQQQTQVGGWVYNGNVALYNGICWVSDGPANANPAVTFMGPYSQNCQTSTCQGLCDDIKAFDALVKECCPPNQVFYVSLTSDFYPPYNPNNPSIIYFDGTMYNGQAQIQPGCYKILEWETVDGSIENTHEVQGYWTSCEQCTDYNISPDDPCSQTDNIWESANCCDPSDIIYVTMSPGIIVNLSDNPGFTYNGSCYRLLNTIQNQVPTIPVTLNNYIHGNICQTLLCPDCPTPSLTPSLTPTPTPNVVPWEPEIRSLELLGCCNNETYTVNINLNIETVVNDYVYIISNSSELSSGCYQVTSINNQSSVSYGSVIQNYGQDSCLPCLSSYPCLQQYTGCSDNCQVVGYPYDTAEYTFNGITYSIPLIVTEPAHLSPLANEDGVVTNEAWLAMIHYWFTVDGSCAYIPWVCDQVGNDDESITTADLLIYLGLFGSLESTINESITCPSVYTQGLSPVLNQIYYVPQEDRCYEYVGNVNNNGQPIINFSVNTSYTDCTDCIDTMLPSPTPTPTITPTTTVTPTMSPTVTPSLTPTLTVTPTSTPTDFIYKVMLSGCCDNVTYLETIQFTSQITQITDTFFWEGNNTQNLIPQCYTILNFIPSTDTPSFTINNDTPYSDCEECLAKNPCNYLYKAVPCCQVGLEPIFVTVNDTNLPILGFHGLVYDHNCYLIVNGAGTGSGIITITSDDYLPNICNDLMLFNQYCEDCQQPSPSVTPSVTNTPSITVTPTLTPTSTVTPTLTPSVTNTVTPTPSTYPSQTGIQVERCCDDVIVGTVTVQFVGSITSLSVGDSFVYNTVPYNVVSITSTQTPYGTFTISDSDIFTGGVDNCIDAILSQPNPCKTAWYSGCTTGNVYLGLGNYPYYNTGTYRYGPDVFGDYGDYCVEVIENGNYSSYITVVVDNPLLQINNCCSYPSNTPTPTVTSTPTLTPTLTPTFTPTPSVTQTPIPEAIQCGDSFSINTTAFNNVLNPDGTYSEYSTTRSVVNSTLNLGSCAGTVTFAFRPVNIPDRFIITDSNDNVVIDTLYIGGMQYFQESLINFDVNQGPSTFNTFEWNQSTSELEFVGNESITPNIYDYAVHSDEGNFTYPNFDNVLNNGGYGALGQIGGTLFNWTSIDGVGYYNPNDDPSKWCDYGLSSPDAPYAFCGGNVFNSAVGYYRVFSFDKPSGSPFYNLKIISSPRSNSSTGYYVTLLECPSC